MPWEVIFACHAGIVCWGAGIAFWLERRTRNGQVAVRVPAGAAGEFSSPELTLCADSYSCLLYTSDAADDC